MQAYSAAKTRNVKTQILSLYDYRYPARTLQRIHETFAKLTSWQIKRARAHARECSPGSSVEKQHSHRVRLLPAKLDHFLDFVNRPYFYQDVAFGTRKLKLKSGEKLTMPNIIRKVTRATMIRQYLKFCEEEQYEPLSRASLFRVLKVREAFERPLNQFPTRDSYLNLIIMASLVTVFLGSRTSYWITLHYRNAPIEKRRP